MLRYKTLDVYMTNICNVGETAESRGGARMGFSELLDTILY